MATLAMLLDAFNDDARDETARRSVAVRAGQLRVGSVDDISTGVTEQLAEMLASDALLELALLFASSIAGLEVCLASHLYLHVPTLSSAIDYASDHLCVRIVHFLRLLSQQSEWISPSDSAFTQLLWTTALDLLNLPVNVTTNNVLEAIAELLYQINEQDVCLLEQTIIRYPAGLQGNLSDEALFPQDVLSLLDIVIIRSTITDSLVINVTQQSTILNDRFCASARRLCCILRKSKTITSRQTLGAALESGLTVFLMNQDIFPAFIHIIIQELSLILLPTQSIDLIVDQTTNTLTLPKRLSSRTTTDTSPKKIPQSHVRLQPLNSTTEHGFSNSINKNSDEKHIISAELPLSDSLEISKLILKSIISRITFALFSVEIIVKHLLIEQNILRSITSKKRRSLVVSKDYLIRLLMTIHIHSFVDNEQTQSLQDFLRNKIVQSLERIIAVPGELDLAVYMLSIVLEMVNRQEEPPLFVSTRQQARDHPELEQLLILIKRVLNTVEHTLLAYMQQHTHNDLLLNNKSQQQKSDKRAVISAPTHSLTTDVNNTELSTFLCEGLPSYITNVRRQLSLCHELEQRRYDSTLHIQMIELGETVARHVDTLSKMLPVLRKAESLHSFPVTRTADLPALKQGGVIIGSVRVKQNEPGRL